MITCPTCKGEKVICSRLYPRPSIKCFMCDGRGKVPPETTAWMERGSVLRERRVRNRESLCDFARRVGIRCQIVADAELGVIDPAVIENTLTPP
jgi:hypothetical protein